MAFEFQCQCGKLLSAEESWVGRNARCPDCGVILIVPPPLEDDDAPVFDPESEGNGSFGAAEHYGDWDEDMDEVTTNPWIARWQAIKQRFHKPNYYQLMGACGIVLLGVTVFLAVKWFGPRLGGPETALADQQASAENDTTVLEELLKPVASVTSTDNEPAGGHGMSADESANAGADNKPTGTSTDSTADNDETTVEPANTSTVAPARPAQGRTATPETAAMVNTTVTNSQSPSQSTINNVRTGNNSTPSQVAVEIVRITNQGDSTAFQAIRRHGLFLPSGEELALVLDSEHRAFDSRMSKAVSRQVLSSIAFNDGDLLFWLEEAQYFSQELTIQGKPAKDMLHFLVFPHTGGDESTLAFKRFKPGNVRDIKELEKRYGPAEQYQYWQLGSPQFDGEVYWWGNVGAAADADNRITFVLLRAPQMTK